MVFLSGCESLFSSGKFINIFLGCCISSLAPLGIKFQNTPRRIWGRAQGELPDRRRLWNVSFKITVIIKKGGGVRRWSWSVRAGGGEVNNLSKSDPALRFFDVIALSLLAVWFWSKDLFAGALSSEWENPSSTPPWATQGLTPAGWPVCALWEF